MYEANVDDVGYRLVVVYTPIRDDGVEGHPVSASTEPVAVGKFFVCYHHCHDYYCYVYVLYNQLIPIVLSLSNMASNLHTVTCRGISFASSTTMLF